MRALLRASSLRMHVAFVSPGMYVHALSATSTVYVGSNALCFVRDDTRNRKTYAKGCHRHRLPRTHAHRHVHCVGNQEASEHIPEFLNKCIPQSG